MSAKPQVEVDLRPWSQDDLPLLERLMGDPAIIEHLGGPEKIRERHARYLRSNDSDQARMFVIIVGPERIAAGSIGYWERTWQGELVWETGWRVLPEFQGQGIASRAAVVIMERARLAGKHRFIHAFPSVYNAASNAVCRKAGFTPQGAVDFGYQPGHLMRCNDWRLDLFAGAPQVDSA